MRNVLVLFARLRARPARTFSSLGAWGLLCFLLFACGPKVPAARPLPSSVTNKDHPILAGERVKLLELEGQPNLQVIRRSGDPKGAVAVAVFPPGGSTETILMAALLKGRLEDGPDASTTQVHGIGVVRAWEVESVAEATELLKRVQKALTTPVSAADAKEWSKVIQGMLKAARTRVDEPSPYAACMGILGAEGREALSWDGAGEKDLLQRLEAARKATAHPARIGLSVLGAPELIEGIESGLSVPWPSGGEFDDAWSPGVTVAMIDSTGGREVRAALRLARSDAALAAARTLSSPDHAIHARLSALDSRFTAEPPEVALRPAGACAALTVTYDASAPAPSEERLAEVASLVMEELKAATETPVLPEERSLSLLSPEGALEGAALGAWTAVRSRKTGGAQAEVIEVRRPRGDVLSKTKLTRAISEEQDAWKKQLLPTTTKKEPGQPELWMLLASPCGTAPETEEDAGLRALTVATLAKNYTDYQGVRLLPWISAEGIGLVAHAPVLPQERPTQQATRVARALARAFAGPPVDGRAVAEARDAQVDHLAEDPGEGLLMSVIGAGYPSLLFPLGTEKSIAHASGAHVESIREGLLQEPLSLTVLENSEADQGKAAQTALSRWLHPFRKSVSPCPERLPSPATPGTWTLETIEPTAREGSIIAVFTPARRPLGKALEYLLNRRGGYLERALHTPGLAAHAEAEWIGGARFGALVIRVGAEAHLLEKATMQIRALLDRLRERGVTSEDLALAKREYARIEAASERRPEGRLIRAHLGEKSENLVPEDALTVASLNALLKTLGADQHRVLTVKVRK